MYALYAAALVDDCTCAFTYRYYKHSHAYTPVQTFAHYGECHEVGRVVLGMILEQLFSNINS